MIYNVKEKIVAFWNTTTLEYQFLFLHKSFNCLILKIAVLELYPHIIKKNQAFT